MVLQFLKLHIIWLSSSNNLVFKIGTFHLACQFLMQKSIYFRDKNVTSETVLWFHSRMIKIEFYFLSQNSICNSSLKKVLFIRKLNIDRIADQSQIWTLNCPKLYIANCFAHFGYPKLRLNSLTAYFHEHCFAHFVKVAI